MRRVGRLHFRIAILAWIAILATVTTSLTASAAPDARPGATAPAPSGAADQFILTVQPLTVNGSSAASIIILSTETITIVSPLGEFGIFLDAACTELVGTNDSPFTAPATSVRDEVGSTFSLAPTAQVTDCHQVSIVDPTPTPAPTNTPVPTATPTNTPTPAPTPTLAPDQISINGSEASSVTAVSDSSIRIESASGWIAFYSDDACGDFFGTDRSPFDQPASVYSALYGASFSVTGATESSVPTTSCRQVSIVDPTPTPSPTPSPTPTMFMSINGSMDQHVVVPYSLSFANPVDFDTPEVSGGAITLHMFRAECDEPLVNGTSRTFPGGGAFSVSDADLVPISQGELMAIYAERSTDGAQSPCQSILFTDEGSIDPTATPTSSPSPPVTPTVPANAPSATSTALVTGLPQTGSGSGSSPGLSAIVLGTAMALFVAAFGIERRRHRRASR